MDDPQPLDVEQEWKDHRERLSRLSRREKEVYQHLRLAKQNKEIASALAITVRTVRFHVSNTLHKLGVSSRIELLAKHWPESQ